MTVRTEIFTQHHVTRPGVGLTAAMMLNENGDGTFTLLNGDDPIVTLDAAKLDGVDALFQECIDVRRMMKMRADDLLAGPLNTD